MRTKQSAPGDIDEYVAGFPAAVQEIQEKIRMTIRTEAPGAEQTITYKLPTLNPKARYLISLAAYTKHIGLYAAFRESNELKTEVSGYEGGKGTVRFPFGTPVPYAL